MSTTNPPLQQPEFLSKATEVAIRLALFGLLGISCFFILRPFILPVVWAVIIAAAMHPTFDWLQSKLGGRAGLAAAFLALMGILIIVIPAILSATSLVESAQWLTASLNDGSLEIPAPPEEVETLPLIGKPLHECFARFAPGLTKPSPDTVLQLLDRSVVFEFHVHLFVCFCVHAGTRLQVSLPRMSEIKLTSLITPSAPSRRITPAAMPAIMA